MKLITNTVRTLLVTVVLAIAPMTTLISSQSPADALCVTPQEEGNWRNTDPQSNHIPEIRLRFVCQDVILNGQPPGPSWYVHVFGKCSPTNCDWGEVPAQRLSSGQIYAVYNQGFATKYVYAKMSQYRPGQLWVYTSVDFADPNRADYTKQEWFERR